ncbi:MAG TPA: hypothetical protein VH302_08830 [Bryobacteraceae bacterium]|jgi:hypothetical protein|nr:hypothetical protein [Bryobacteraceae bacterium]
MLNSIAVIVPLLLGCITLGLFLPILRSIGRKPATEDITPEWLDSFSVSAYYPMQGLLSDEDFTFLSCQPGFDVSLYRKLRRDRLHIFRQYLLRLILDFNRLHAVARMILSHSAQDRSDVVAKIMRLKIRFSLAVLQAEASYMLCLIGFRFLAVRSLIAALEEMSLELSSLARAHAAA